MSDENGEDKGIHANVIAESVRSNVSQRSYLQDVVSGRSTENINNDVRYTEVENDYLNLNPIEGLKANEVGNHINDNDEKKEGENKDDKDNKSSANDNTNKKISNPSYNTNKQKFNSKIIVIGDIAVGKTSVIARYITNTFTEDHISSIACELKEKTIRIGMDIEVNLQIWDTVGEERFMAVTKQYYNNAHGAMIVYDLANKSSFIQLNKWIKDVINNAPKNIVIMIVGNKCDLPNKIDFSNELNQFKQNYMYYEVSAKNGTNISLAFEELALKIIEKQKEKGNEDNGPGDSIPLKKNSGKQKEKKCQC